MVLNGTPARASPRTRWWRPIALLTLIATAALAAALLGAPEPRVLRAQVAEAGPLAPAAFVLLYALVTLLPVPKNVLAATAGALFGIVLGTAVVVLAALIGAATAFAISRTLGRETVERLAGERVARVDAAIGRSGTLGVVAVRLVPVLPFTAINYAAGLTSVRVRAYALGTAIGILPGTVSFVALGSFGTSPGSWPFLVSLTALVLLTGGGLLLSRRSPHNRSRGTPTTRGDERPPA